MPRRPHNFVLKLLTSSKEVNLRRLRSYAASLGGDAAIFHSYDELLHPVESLENSLEHPLPSAVVPSVVLSDGTIALSPLQLAAIKARARIFVLQHPLTHNSPHHYTRTELPPEDAAVWRADSFMTCTLTTFLESPIIRMSLSQTLPLERSFQLSQLLRWGHAATTWETAAEGQTRPAYNAEHGHQFARRLSLTGEGRRLVEMFSHFLQTSLGSLGLIEDAVTFGSDGLLVAGIVRCRHADPQKSTSLREIVRAVRTPEFQVAIVKEDASGAIELAGCHHQFAHPVHTSAPSREPTVLVFRVQRQEPASGLKSEDSAQHGHKKEFDQGEEPLQSHSIDKVS